VAKRSRCLHCAGTQDGSGLGRISKTTCDLALPHPIQICICRETTDTEYCPPTQSNGRIHKLRLRRRKCDHRDETRCRRIVERDFCLGKIRMVDKPHPEKGQISRPKLWRPGHGCVNDTVPQLPATSMYWLASASSPSICMFHPC